MSCTEEYLHRILTSRKSLDSIDVFEHGVSSVSNTGDFNQNRYDIIKPRKPNEYYDETNP
jgi:hypothetical protein